MAEGRGGVVKISRDPTNLNIHGVMHMMRRRGLIRVWDARLVPRRLAEPSNHVPLGLQRVARRL